MKKRYDIIVIFAGPAGSMASRWAEIETYIDFRDMESAYQITASNIPVDQHTHYFYFVKENAPQRYFCIFPKGNHLANIGLGVYGLINKKKSAKSFFNNFMRKNYPRAPVLTQIAGGVSCTPTLKKMSAPGILVANYVARQVNPLSGGGIASGMIGGKIAGRIAGESVKINRSDQILSYDKTWHERLGNRHVMFERLKNSIYNFSDEKFNSIARKFSKVPESQRSIGKVFRAGLWNKPSLLVDVEKAFF